EVGLPGAEPDDALTGGLECLGLRVDGEGRRGGDRGETFGDAVHEPPCCQTPPPIPPPVDELSTGHLVPGPKRPAQVVRGHLVPGPKWPAQVVRGRGASRSFRTWHQMTR